MKATTLLLLVQGDPITRVLIGFKKIGFGKGKYTGVGGKVEPGETIEAAAIREMREETSIVVEERHLLSRGHIDFYFPSKPEWNLTIHIFLARHWQGIPTESGEIRPQWFDVQHLPFENMWDDAAHWYGRVLRGEKIRATFTFKPDNETIDTYQFQCD
jgi:8-oxo-dGTP diphosphatase